MKIASPYILAVLVISIFISAAFLLLSGLPLLAQESKDAIAVRVIPNPDHYSAFRWYDAAGFAGSPQSIIVDGYEGIRDGRSVYVNVGNVDDKETAATGDDELLTNIYLLSYNQEAEQPTVDIFSRLLNHWRFNTNIATPGDCSLDTSQACVLDSDCSLKDFCLSDKSKIIHDVRRLADLADIRTALEDYRDEKNIYPALKGGSYIKGGSLSVWPSWQKVLAYELKISMPLDPINKLGPCPADYHPITCWDETTKQFFGSIPDGMPSGSRAYAYQATGDDSFELCAELETMYPNLNPDRCSLDIIPNRAPEIVNNNFPVGYIGMEYSAFLNAVDPDGDEIIWTISATGSWPGWSAPPGIEDSRVEDERRVHSLTAGNAGIYSVTVTVSDGTNSTSGTYNISIINPNDPIITPIGNQSVVIGRDLSFYIRTSEIAENYPFNYIFSGVLAGFNSSGGLAANLHDYLTGGVVTGDTGDYLVSLTVTDSLGYASVPEGFTVTVTNNPPVITSPLSASLVGCSEDLSYQVQGSDPDGHSINYSVSGLPTGLTFNSGTGIISGIAVAAAGSYDIDITARDEYFSQTSAPYSAEARATLRLSVTNITFTVNAPSPYNFYATPAGVPVTDLYHGPFPFIAAASKSGTTAEVSWSISYTSSMPPIPGLSVLVNPINGIINISAFDNNIPSGGYDFTVDVTAATIGCGASGNNSFDLSVFPNEWCGDGVEQGGNSYEITRVIHEAQFGECVSCGGNASIPAARDDGNLPFCIERTPVSGTDECDPGYSKTLISTDYAVSVVGSCIIDVKPGEGFYTYVYRCDEIGWEECDDGNTVDGDGCNTANSNCLYTCGDGVITVGEECDIGASLANCLNSCVCRLGYANCDGSAGNGCEGNLNSNANCGTCGNTCGSGYACSGGSCELASYRITAYYHQWQFAACGDDCGIEAAAYNTAIEVDLIPLVYPCNGVYYASGVESCLPGYTRSFVSSSFVTTLIGQCAPGNIPGEEDITIIYSCDLD